MKTALARFALTIVPFITSADGHGWQSQVWQADVQIRTLEVTKTRTTITARVVIYNEKDDEARDTRLIILLPLSVGIEKLATGCTATAGPTMLPSLRAAVECDLGSIPDRGIRETLIITTIPPDVVQKRFAVFVYSTTPDPMPANNYAERTIQ
jgi:hypothetical protein